MDRWEEMIKLALSEAQKKKTHDDLMESAESHPCFPLSAPVLTQLLHLMEKPSLLFDAITSELLTLDPNLIRPLVPRIIAAAGEALLLEEHSAKAYEIIFNLTKAAGTAAMLDAVKPLIGDALERVRRKAAAVIGAASPATGVPAILPLLKAACGSKESWQARHTGVMAVERVAAVLGDRLGPHVVPLVVMVHPSLSSLNVRVLRRAAASSVAALAGSADSAYKDLFNVNINEPVIKSIFKGVCGSREDHDAFMVPMWAIIQLRVDDQPREAAYCCCQSVMCDSVIERRRADIAIRMLDRCLDIQVEGTELRPLFDRHRYAFFRSFWAISAREHLKAGDYRSIANATAKLSVRLLGLQATLGMVDEQLRGDHAEPYVRMVKKAVLKFHSAYTLKLNSAQHWEEGLRIMHWVFSFPSVTEFSSTTLG